MTTSTETTRIELFHEDIKPRLAKASHTILGHCALVQGRNSRTAVANLNRLERKAAGVAKVLEEQGDRIDAIKTPDQLVVLVALIQTTYATDDMATASGVQLATSYMMEYVR